MGSRRGRLNWSNLEVHISNAVIEKQHHFNVSNAFSSSSIQSTVVDVEQETPPPAPTKRSWMPKIGVGEVSAELFVRNCMLTDAEQTSIDRKYKNQARVNEQRVVQKKVTPTTETLQLSKESTLLPARSTPLRVGQHLRGVFVSHVETYSRIHLMCGDDFARATNLFRNMNTCEELTRTPTSVFQPKEKDLMAVFHAKQWFRGQCLGSIGANVNVKCLDWGKTIVCAPSELRRLPDAFRTTPPCCIESNLSGLPTTVAMSSIPDNIHAECLGLLYKDNYEAIVTRLDVSNQNQPTLVLYFGDLNINDRLLSILKLI